MAGKRAPVKSAISGHSAATGPLFNALLLAAAVGYGLLLLVNHGRLSWPPNQLLASLYTVAGCLAVVGPSCWRVPATASPRSASSFG